MVSFEYFRKLEEECMGYHKRFTEMHFKEELDRFVPDKILYEKEWKCKWPPHLGSYDTFFYPFNYFKKPKKPKILDTPPKSGEYWKYLFSKGELKYVLQCHDGKEYATCYVIVPEGFVGIDRNRGDDCNVYKFFYLIFDHGKRFVFVDNQIKQVEPHVYVEIPCFEINEYVLDDKGFDLFKFTLFYYSRSRYDYDAKGVPLCYHEDSRYISYKKLLSNILEAHFFITKEEEDAFKKFMVDSYYDFLKRGYKEVDDIDGRDELLAKYLK